LPPLVIPVLFAAQQAGRPPNVLYIMAAELACFELGHMGHPHAADRRDGAITQPPWPAFRVRNSAQ
jgi:hypothetical protein